MTLTRTSPYASRARRNDTDSSSDSGRPTPGPAADLHERAQPLGQLPLVGQRLTGPVEHRRLALGQLEPPGQPGGDRHPRLGAAAQVGDELFEGLLVLRLDAPGGRRQGDGVEQAPAGALAPELDVRRVGHEEEGQRRAGRARATRRAAQLRCSIPAIITSASSA